MTFLYFILILIVLVIVHEFGHFTVAKLFGIRVDEFGIFFPPRLFAIKKGETEYSFNAIPVGGFVKIFGENGEVDKQPLPAGRQARSFIRKPRLVQAAVIVAGIAFNLLFAWLVLTVGYMVGLPTSVGEQHFGTVQNPHVLVVGVLSQSPAALAGIQSGDQIEQVQTGTAQLSASEARGVTDFISTHQDESVVVTVQRNGEQKIFLAKATSGLMAGRKAIGVQLADVGTLKLPVHLAMLEAATLGWSITKSTAVGLGGFVKQIFSGHADFGQVAGPIGITVFGAAMLHQGFAAAVMLIALISINLAVINLIPIPGLDGGRLFIIIIESVLRRPISPKLITKFTLAGFAALILLMLVVSYHDIARLIG